MDNVVDLRNWMVDVQACNNDAVLEFLKDRNLHNEKGLILASDFWEKYIEEREDNG